MKGLLLKEFLMLKKNWVTLMIFFLAFGVSGIVANRLMSIVFPLFTAMLLYSHIYYDEQSKWQQYSIALPYDRKMIVSAKYAAMGIVAVISTALSIILYVFSVIFGKASYSVDLFVGYTVLSIATGIIYPTFLLPLAYKFNSEKGKMILLLLIIASGGISAIFLNVIEDTGIIVKLSNYTNMLPYVFIAVLIVLFALSWFISVKIYEKRDL